ncbi:MAG: hypothetical protein JWM68_3410 [Verrucomicrobiales bacterium]|nr:hypothetical protein [Verrucomicrobiales bacterium]
MSVAALFYPVENWRGKRAWENYKKELEAKGESLDLDAFLPETIPDEENVLRAPVMARLLNKQWTPRQLRVPESGVLTADWAQGKPSDLPEWNQIFGVSNSPLVIATGFAAPLPTNDALALAVGEVIPLIVLDDVSLMKAIRLLAFQGDLSLSFSPEVKGNTNLNLSSGVTIRFESVTARQALAAVLDNHGLKLVPNRTNRQTFEVVLHKTEIVMDEASVAKTNTGGEHIYSRVLLKDASLTNAIESFAEASRISFKFDTNAWKQVQEKASHHGIYPAKVSARWDDLTAREALESLLEMQSFVMTTNVDGHFEITFHPRTAADILEDLEQFDADFKEIYEACARPKAKFDSDYKNVSRREFPNMSPLRAIAQSLGLRASVQLALNKNEEALRDIQTCIRLADCFTNEPTLVGGMMRVAFDGIIIVPIWEGLAARRWNEKQLSELQQALDRIDLLSSTIRSIRGTRAYETLINLGISPEEVSKSLDYAWLDESEKQSRNLKRLAIPCVPRGWIYQNIALMNRLSQENNIDVIDLNQSVISPSKVEAGKKRTEAAFKVIRPGNFLASIAFGEFSRALRSMAQNQIQINEAVIACALERHRLVHGSFPETLEALAPKFLTKIPHDIINGQPLKYRRTDDGQYILYSVAWDEKDDDARPMPQTWNGTETGDWAWRFPAKRTAAVSAGSAASR